MKLLLLDAHEGITQLQSSAGRHAWWAQWAPTHAEGHATPEQWAALYQDLGDLERDVDQMVAEFRASMR